MADKDQAIQTGNDLFEAFVEQIKQALEHLYDFAYLQQHPLARVYDGAGDLSAKTAGRQLRHELITAIESLKPKSDAHFRAPDARLYNLLHLIYVENLTIQGTAIELGLSERQAYRDLKRGQEAVAAALWNSRLPSSEPTPEFSLRSEMAHLKLNFSPVDVGAIVQQAQHAVERLAAQHAVEIAVEMPREPLILLTDPPLAHQVIVSVLSNAVQRAQPGMLTVSFEANQGTGTLALRYSVKDNAVSLADTRSVLSELAERLHWTISYQDTPAFCEIVLRLISRRVTILVIDDNEGWVALLERFLEGFDCTVVTLRGEHDDVQRIQTLAPSAIILDVMMPETDGWEILQRLRTQPATTNIPIIVCSVFNDPQLAYSLGASAFVSKTTNLDKLLETLKELSII
ncbi:MAG: ATP-binding response regulator [Aggregatilineales bacterium]